MIRKGRLGRICIKCNKTFIPTGKTQKTCEDCKPETNWTKFLKLQRKVNKKKKK